MGWGEPHQPSLEARIATLEREVAALKVDAGLAEFERYRAEGLCGIPSVLPGFTRCLGPVRHRGAHSFKVLPHG